MVHTNKIEWLRVKGTLVRYWIEVDGVVVPPGPGNSEGWPTFERNGRSAKILDARSGDNVHDPTQRTGS